MDVVGDDARAAPLGGGDPDAPAPGAGRSANPWKHAVGVITPNDSSAPNVPRASSVGVARQRACFDRTASTVWIEPTSRSSRSDWRLSRAQLEALGIGDGAPVAPDGTLAGVLMRAYRAMGDALAVQYGGSEAHAKAGVSWASAPRRDVGEEEEGERVAPASFFGFGDAAKRLGDAAASSSAKILVSARRFYSNAVTDADKQEGIDLFLGLRDGPRRGEREHDAGDEPSSAFDASRRRPAADRVAELAASERHGPIDDDDAVDGVREGDDEKGRVRGPPTTASPPLPRALRRLAAEKSVSPPSPRRRDRVPSTPRAVFSAPPHRRESRERSRGRSRWNLWTRSPRRTRAGRVRVRRGRRSRTRRRVERGGGGLTYARGSRRRAR